MNASGDTTSVWADMYNQMGDVMTALANVNATQSANSLDDLMKEGMYGKKLFTKPPNGTNAFITSSIFNSCIFLGGVLAFSMLRRKFPAIYEPRRTGVIPDSKHPPKLSNSLFGWIRTIHNITEDDIYRTSGLDAAMFYRLSYLGVMMFGSFTLYGICILLPVNAIGHGKGEGIESFSMSNINGDDDKHLLVFHAIGMYLFTFGVFYATRQTYIWFVSMRQRFLRGTEPKMYSVMVRNLPKHLQTSQALAAAMDDIAPGEVISAHVNIGDIFELEKLCEDRLAALLKLEKVLYKYKQNPDSSRPRHATSWKHPFSKVDSIQYYAHQVQNFNDKVRAEQTSIKQVYALYGYDLPDDEDPTIDTGSHSQSLTQPIQPDTAGRDESELARMRRKDSPIEQVLQQPTIALADHPELNRDERVDILTRQCTAIKTFSNAKNVMFGANSGFVMFKSHKAATIAAQCDPMASAPDCYIHQAPDPSAVIWKNIPVNTTYRGWRWFGLWAAVIGLTAVYTIPAAAMASLTSLENLSKTFPILKTICDHYPSVKGMLEGVLPQSSIILFSMVMPYILYWLGIFEGHLTWGDLERSVVRKWFMFQGVNVFFAPAVSSSVLQVLTQAQQDISHIPQLLARAIPSASTFFINFTIMRICLTQTMELINLGAVCFYIMGKFQTQSPREVDESKNPGRLMYGDILSRTLLVFLIGATYAVLAPLILPFITLFFAASLFVWKYQLSYVYISEMDTGGLFWFVCFRRIMFSTIFAQVTAFGLFSLKGSLLSIVMVPLPFITMWVTGSLTSKYERKATYLSLDEAIRADIIVRANEISPQEESPPALEEFAPMYLQPLLMIPPLFPRLTEQFRTDNKKSPEDETRREAEVLSDLADNEGTIDEAVDENSPLLRAGEA